VIAREDVVEKLKGVDRRRKIEGFNIQASLNRW
jgi:hypothetical protein